MSDEGQLDFDRVTFDEGVGKQEKDAGMKKAAEARAELLGYARECAITIAKSRNPRLVTADDVQEKLIEVGFSPADLGNSAGSIFKTKDWEWSGQFVFSKRVSNHARLLRVWRLK